MWLVRHAHPLATSEHGRRVSSSVGSNSRRARGRPNVATTRHNLGGHVDITRIAARGADSCDELALDSFLDADRAIDELVIDVRDFDDAIDSRARKLP